MPVTIPDAARVNPQVSLGSGQFSLMRGAASQVQATLTQGSGQSTIDLPSETAVRIQARVQSGTLVLPGGMVRVAGDPHDPDSGARETPGFSAAEQRIFVDAEVGSGALRFR